MEKKENLEIDNNSKPNVKVTFGTLTVGNREILKILVNNCFPITYTDKFYKKLPVLYKDFARLVLLKNIPVGGIVCRVEAEENPDNMENESETGKIEKVEKPKKKNKKKKNKKKEEEEEEEKKEYFVHLMIILVLKEYRRLGIAKQIMIFVYNRIKELKLDVKRIKLHVLKENIGAIEFYKKEGFTILEEIENHYTLDGVDKDAILMGKELN